MDTNRTRQHTPSVHESQGHSGQDHVIVAGPIQGVKRSSLYTEYVTAHPEKREINPYAYGGEDPKMAYDLSGAERGGEDPPTFVAENRLPPTVVQGEAVKSELPSKEAMNAAKLLVSSAAICCVAFMVLLVFAISVAAVVIFTMALLLG